MSLSEKTKTVRRKVAKASHPGACSFGWCHRPATPPFKTCESCRKYLRVWRKKKGGEA